MKNPAEDPQGDPFDFSTDRTIVITDEQSTCKLTTYCSADSAADVVEGERGAQEAPNGEGSPIYPRRGSRIRVVRASASLHNFGSRVSKIAKVTFKRSSLRTFDFPKEDVQTSEADGTAARSCRVVPDIRWNVEGGLNDNEPTRPGGGMASHPPTGHATSLIWACVNPNAFPPAIRYHSRGDSSHPHSVPGLATPQHLDRYPSNSHVDQPSNMFREHRKQVSKPAIVDAS